MEKQSEYVEKKLNEIITTGATNSRAFWKFRKKLLKSDTDNLQAIKDKNGKKLYDLESIKERVADYYEDLYITRKDNMFDPLWSMYIDDKIEEYEKDRNYEGLWVNRRLSLNELNHPIKKIKNGKTVPESDNIPNEFIKSGGNTMREILFNLFDNIMCTEDYTRAMEHWSNL